MPLFPTSINIWLEKSGMKIAVVQSYKSKSTSETKPVEAFGSDEPVGHTDGRKKYTLELTRVYATDDAIKDGIDFYSEKDFDMVIVKPGEKIVYTGCNWTEIGEDADLNDVVKENISLSAMKRRRENV